MLYELLAGGLPFDREDFRGGGIDHIRKLICEKDPPTPSTRLKQSRLDSGKRSPLATSHSSLATDLDWITLKALEKDRTRRYASAGDLSHDIRRHLNHEPVSAARPSLIYQARKFVRRNRALVTSVAAVLVVLVIGIVASLSFALKARRAGRDAIAMTEFLQNHVFKAMDAVERGGLQVNIKESLDIASAEVSNQFGHSPLQEASVRKTLGELYTRVTCFEEGQRHLLRSLELYRRELDRDDPRTLEVLDALGRLYWGWWRYREAEQTLAEVLAARRRQLGPQHPDTVRTQLWLGWTYYAQSYSRKAEQSLAETYRSMRQLHAESHPETLMSRFFHGCALLAYGRYDEAEDTLTRALELSTTALNPSHPMRVYPMRCWDVWSAARAAMRRRKTFSAMRCGSPGRPGASITAGPSTVSRPWQRTTPARAGSPPPRPCCSKPCARANRRRKHIPRSRSRPCPIPACSTCGRDVTTMPKYRSRRRALRQSVSLRRGTPH